MRANREKLQLAMARACMNTDDLSAASSVLRPTVYKVLSGQNVRPGTIGKIARALGVDVLEILEAVKA